MTAMQPRSREEAKLLGLPDWQIDQMFPAMDIEAQHNFDAPARMPQGGLLSAPQPQQGFWQGGDKFRARDGIAGLLAVVGDALSRNSGGEGYATKGLLGGRLDAQEMARKKAEEQAALAEAMSVADRIGTPRDHVLAKQYGVPLPQQPDIPPMVRDVRAWQQMSPEDKRAAQEMYSTRSPWRVMGQDGRPYDMGDDGLPDFIPDEELGGGTGNGAGGFRRY